MAEQKLPKLTTRVRFPSPAPPAPARPRPFASRIAAWQRRHGRHGLPWQGTRDPYRLWLSEVMLQQTQVATVAEYFVKFLARFPDVRSLAQADPEAVLRLWSGLGYYARARNLHRAAREVVERHGGRFPVDAASLEALPGVGRSTAAAIAAFATGRPHAILDGNVKRVMARHFGVAGPVDDKAVVARLWAVAEAALPARGVEAYTQGLMDLGATVCTRARPDCARCPVRATCVALREDRIDSLPGRKAPRPRGSREVAMLVIVAGGEVLLERRPPAGVWGGLWSLPEAPAGVDPAAWVAENVGLRVARVEPLAPFTHAFTHFVLGVRPILVRVRRERRARTAAGTTWLALAEAGGAALPAPVKRLLASLAAASR